MIDLYFWTTDNGYKARQGMEESGLNYTIKPVSIPKKEQFEPEFLKINPAHKIPVIIDHENRSACFDRISFLIGFRSLG